MEFLHCFISDDLFLFCKWQYIHPMNLMVIVNLIAESSMAFVNENSASLRGLSSWL